MAAKTNGEEAKNDAKPKSKMEAVRWSLRTLGKDAKPIKIQEHLKNEYQIVMSVAHISNYKSEIQKNRVKKKKKAARLAAAAAASQAESHPAAANAKARNSIPLDDIQEVKDLVGRVGANNLKSLIDLLGK